MSKFLLKSSKHFLVSCTLIGLLSYAMQGYSSELEESEEGYSSDLEESKEGNRQIRKFNDLKPMPSLTQLELTDVGRNHIKTNFLTEPQYKNVNNGTADFRDKHVLANGNTQACFQKAEQRIIDSRMGSTTKHKVKISTVSNKEPMFLNGTAPGQERFSLNASSLTTSTLVSSGGDNLTQASILRAENKNVNIKGNTNNRNESDPAKVNHYGGHVDSLPIHSDEYKVKRDFAKSRKQRKNEKIALAVGTGVQIVTHLGDHAIFKKAQHTGGDASIGDVHTEGSGGSASASFLKASATQVSADLGKKVHAGVSGGKAEVSTRGIPGTGPIGAELFAPMARADFLAADSYAEASALGIRASANITDRKCTSRIYRNSSYYWGFSSECKHFCWSSR